jgi:tryptophan-rich sensory protein
MNDKLPDHLATISWVDGFGFVAFLALCFGAAAVGGQFSPDQWYAELARPAVAPPNWVFGPVWTILYTAMAVAAWLVWKQRRSAPVVVALILFIVQLVVNTSWSWQFFGRHRIDHALITIGILVALILATILAFRKHSRWAARLLLPYLLWVGFATFLNYEFWRLNP